MTALVFELGYFCAQRKVLIAVTKMGADKAVVLDSSIADTQDADVWSVTSERPRSFDITGWREFIAPVRVDGWVSHFR